MEDIPRPAPDAARVVVVDGWRRLRSDPRVGVALLLLIAIAAGVAWFRAGIAPAAPPTGTAGGAGSAGAPRRSSTPSSSTTTSTAGRPLVVYVIGAVRTPGIVQLQPGARIVDAILAAGGSIAGADVARLNLAAPVADGERIAVPLVGQPPPALDPTAVSAAGSPTQGTDGSGTSGTPTVATVNINTATVAELDTLPGIGPATAAAIIRERDTHGQFRSVDDLERVKGIGPAKLAQLRDHVTV
jgi:competence protein ComEA